MAGISATSRPSVELVSSGIKYFKKAITTTTPGIEQTLISDTILVGKTVNLLHLQLSCREQATFRILIAGSQVGSGRTGPGGDRNIFFPWTPDEVAIAGSLVEVKFLQMSARPNSVDVEAYLTGREV